MPHGQGIAQGLFEPGNARGGFADGVQVLLERDLLGRVSKSERGEPSQMSCSPRGPAGISDAIAKQQGLQTMTAVALLAPQSTASRESGHPSSRTHLV
jgi:hypothetical protein